MSSPQPPQLPPPPPVQIQPGPDSELEQLLAQWEPMKAEVDRKAKELKTLADRIKLLLAQWGPEVVVSSPVLTGGPLRYHPKPRTKWDHTGLTQHYPAITEQFSSVHPVWYLDRL